MWVGDMTEYEIKALKSLSSGAYTATLYKDGKRVATVEDDGRGGMPRVDWIGVAPNQSQPLFDEFSAWAAANTPLSFRSYGGIAVNAGWEIGLGWLVEAADMDKLTKRGTRTVACHEGDIFVYSDAALVPAEFLVWDRARKEWRHHE